MMKIIIAGSRSINNYNVVIKAIEESNFEITELVCGMAGGVDLLGFKYAVSQKIKIKEFPAKWNDLSEPCVIKTNKFGKQYNALAGHNRNEEMAKYVARDNGGLILVHSNTPGSLNMLKIGKKYNLKIFEVIIK